MKTIFPIFIIVAVIAGGIFLISSLGGESENSDGTSQQNTNSVFDLSFKDYEGNEVSLADYKGKALVVNSWAAWCPFCLKEMPDFDAAQKEFGEDVVIIAINRVEALSVAQKFSDQRGIKNIILLLDPKDTFYRKIGGFSMPETLFIDKDGNTQIHKRGVMDLAEITSHITALLEN